MTDKKDPPESAGFLRRHLRRILMVAMAASFASVCTRSAVKLARSEFTRSVSVMPGPPEPPSYTICVHLDAYNSSGDFVRSYDLVQDVWLEFYVSNDGFRRLNDSRWRLTHSWYPSATHLTDGSIYVTHCYTVDVFGFTEEEEAQGRQVELMLHVPDGMAGAADDFQAMIHDRGQHVSHLVPAMGSALTMGKTGKLKMITYTPTVVRLSPASELGCAEERTGEVGFMECLDRYLQSRVGCRLPWIEHDEETAREDGAACEGNSLAFLTRFAEIFAEVKLLNVVDLAAATGCAVRCQHQTFEVSYREGLSLETWAEVGGEAPSAGFQYFTRVDEGVSLEVEVPIYSLRDLVADTGGYMGLLLGASALSMYDVASRAIWGNMAMKS